VIWLDDEIGSHPKTLKAGAEASWMWASACGYARRHLTNGFVPTEALPTLGRFETDVAELAKRLVQAKGPSGKGLFEPTRGGFIVHDYLEHNGTRDDALAFREKEAARKAAWRARQRPGNVPAGQPRDNGTCPDDVPTGRLRPRARAFVPVPVPVPPYPPRDRGGRLTRTDRKVQHRLAAGGTFWERCAALGHKPACQSPTQCEVRVAVEAACPHTPKCATFGACKEKAVAS